MGALFQQLTKMILNRISANFIRLVSVYSHMKFNSMFPSAFISRLITVSALLSFVVPITWADQFPDWIFNTKLTAEDEGDGDEFGREIAVDGDIVIVGAQDEDGAGLDRGAAYLINYKTGEELFKLTASDAEDDDNFGQDVGISGDVAVVTADAKTMDTGTAYLFNVTTGAQGPTLVPSVVEAAAFFGLSCDIEGNYVIVGAPGEDLGEDDRGAAYVFNATTGVQLFRLTAPDGVDFDYFGESVAVAGNYAVVAAPYASGGGQNESGKVYVFDLSDSGNFSHMAVPSVIEVFSYFGASVAAHGNYLVAGSPEEDAGGNRFGAAYLFELATGNLVKRVVSSSPSNFGYFGDHVAISDDLMIVGARDENAGGDERGAAYVFSVPQGNLLQRIAAPDADDEDYFGIGVAINDEYAFAGADEENNGPVERGALYVFNGTTLPPAVATCDTALKTALLKKAKKLKKKAKAARKNGQVAKANRLTKKAKKLQKKANALC